MGKRDPLSSTERNSFLLTLKERFEKNVDRHSDLKWSEVEARLIERPGKLKCLHRMEMTGGEPDVLQWDQKGTELLFVDCSSESPKGRRSLCYDRPALEERKKYPPENSAMDVATDLGVELLSEEDYRRLQHYGPFDTKTSSWLKTPQNVRALGGALFGDHRYGRVFIYHNGAQSYYAARGFRGKLII